MISNFIKTLLVSVLFLVATVPAHAHVPADSIADVHGKKPGLFKRLFHRHKDAPQWDGVHPDLRAKLERIQLQMKEEGYDLRLAEGYRSEQRQAELLASQKGVTQVGPGRSCHNHGFAADMVIHKRGRPSWNLKNDHVRQGYERYGELAQAAGLRWGGAWTDFKDMPHVEMRAPCLVAIRSYRAVQEVRVAAVVPEPLPPLWPGLDPLAITPAEECVGFVCRRPWEWSVSTSRLYWSAWWSLPMPVFEGPQQCPVSTDFRTPWRA